ncbi:hypothetical protein D8B26_000215 [Coccidioides posadasii str. Silveira]|uniref:Tetratricopeptide repeat containing protein n=1 Tax=Coccidioides posadasii (strain C735) TaxID=222929 RepID=C5PC07_COCP7|nr:tetratricopeptide repeat containing protein [Coccidioides posadasii C735 delta SOWgp]EER25484.1 tetratricopeptide repeat containing protein [Coccidioides posadasii C735 delta SOWgp]QVM05508.1 hypothetical protein D8B26_000215 [Coccidioides posadasii str. Silveira]|eukprot:XP_003067629.1 tetratricopeptide repeat containing protein [Coccidioides posadasii C735 delta SOWgp]
MSAHPQRSPTGAVHPHQTPLPPHPQVNGHLPIQAQGQSGPPLTTWQKILQVNEAIWLQLGNLCEMMGNLDGAIDAYQHALRHNQYSVPAMSAISCIYRTKEEFPKAIEFLQNILKIDPQSGESWSSLGHCYLMIDNLQDAYSAYQNALYHLRDPKEPKLWYGIGILYDRYGSLDHAEEAFSQVMRMQPDFEKANEIYFRLGIIYKQQQKFHQSLECFRYIVKDPPRPLTEEDIWFQIGHVHEQQKDFEAAKAAYKKVLDRDPQHAKVLQQLGWLHHQQSSSYASQEQAIEYLEKSVAADTNDAQSWYLLGRCYMSQAKYPKAYEAYQQAVYRDGRNPTFWCSIGVLYYQINQYRDALDAYSRAIRLNPYISEVWYDLGTLYESCNNQIADALDAYSRAAELDPNNVHIKARLQLLQSGQAANQGNAPVPQDVHPQAYQVAGVGPPGPQWGAQAPSGAPPAQPSVPSARVTEWARGVNEVQGQAATSNQYDQRENLRGIQPQHPSPRSDQVRPPFPDQARNNAGRKGLSPSPKFNLAAPNNYPGPQTLPQLGAPPQGAERGPNGAAFGSSVRPPPLAQNGANGPAGINGAAAGAQMPPYGRPFTPPTEIRPIRDDRPTSPRSTYPHPQYHQAPAPQNGGGIAGGAPAPAAAIAAAEAAQRERDERPPSSMKRGREWESDQGPSKKIANEENRARLDEQPGRIPSPRELRRRSSSEVRREEQRRGHDNYHPSDAAHHPPSLPSIQHMQPQQPPKIPSVPDTPASVQAASLPSMPSAGLPSGPVAPSEERDRKDQAHVQHEPPARKMEVDEDYDDDGEDDKKGAALSKNGSPGGAAATAGVANGTSQSNQSKAEPSS